MEKAREERKHTVLPEGEDPRIVEAAVRANGEGVADIVLLGSDLAIARVAEGLGLALDGIETIDPNKFERADAYAGTLFELRRHKGMSLDEARARVKDPLTFAALMVNHGGADGMVAGAVNTTADVVRTAIQVIGIALGFKLVSSFFLMMLCEPFHNTKGGLIFSAA